MDIKASPVTETEEGMFPRIAVGIFNRRIRKYTTLSSEEHKRDLLGILAFYSIHLNSGNFTSDRL